MSEARERVLAMMRQKAALETEVVGINRQLADMGIGPQDRLVDAEGFPRADVDLVVVRTLRNRLARLQTDHMELMKKIEADLPNALPVGAGPSSTNEQRPARGTNSPVQSSSSSASASSSGGGGGILVQNGSSQRAHSAAPLGRSPFCLVDEVSEGSPAQAAGVELNDRIVQFGEITATNGGMSRLAALVGANEGREIILWVQRSSNLMQLTLTPMKWSGRGLLGCHLAPI